MRKTEEKIPEMPKAYKTPAGRIVRANERMHRAVVRGKFNYTPVEELPGEVEAKRRDDEAVMTALISLKAEGVDLAELSTEAASLRLGRRVTQDQLKKAAK